MVSRLLTLTHYIYIEVFLKKAEIISIEVNVIFNKCDEVLQYDLENALNKLGINEDWKS